LAYLEGSLDNLQQELSARFVSLRDSRPGLPVYALEHGLDSERLQILRDAVGAAVRRMGVNTWWRARSLPLLVVATEVGYGYRGTGTDFWPALCSVLATELSFTEHVRLSELFAAAHATLGLKRPADTPWNRLFHHIAWPISNAIAPVEIHRGLAQALQRVFQSPPTSLEGADFAGALRAASRAMGSPRLEEWVADQGLSVALSRRLMGLDHDNVISFEAMERIWRDLSADTVARRAMRLAMRDQRGPTRTSRATAAAPAKGVLQLLSAGSGEPQLALSVSFPDVTDAQRRLVRGLSLPPWAGAEPIGLEAFLLGYPQMIELQQLSDVEVGFLPGLGEIVSDAVLRERLSGAAPDVTLPLVFVGTSEVGRQARERSLSRHEAAWLVTDDGEAPAGVVVAGRIGSAFCLHVSDPSRVADWLARQGVSVRDLTRLELVDAVVVGETPRGPVIGHGLPALFRLIGTEAANVGAGPGDPGVSLGPNAPYLLARTGAGEQELTVSFEGRSNLLTWNASAADRDAEDPLEIDLDPAAPSLEMLRRGEVAIHIRTSLRLAPGSLTLSVVAGEHVVASSRAFGVQLPALLAAGNEMVEELVRALGEVDVPRGSDAWLAVDVENLCRHWFPLNREVRRVAWERYDRDWRPRLEDQILDLEIIEADRPLEAMRPGKTDDADAVRLLLPVAGDGPVDQGGFVVGPRRLNVAASPTIPGHLGRSWRGGETAVQAICLNYLRWSWAEARNPLLEAGRRRVAARLEAASVVQFCGAAWSKIEAHYGRMAPDRWTALAEAAMAGGLAAGPDFPDLNGWKNAALVRHLAQRMAGMVPDLFAAGVVTDAAAEQLDLAVGEAWEDLFEEVLRREGRFVLEDVDPGNGTEDWTDAVVAALDRVRFAGLLPFVMPRSRAIALDHPEYQDLSLDEVGDILVANHVDLSARGQPRWISDHDVRRALLFWARPAALSTDPDWMGAMQRLLSDRQTARTVRYAALRHAASRGRRT
jgi:hypothetical protein